MSIAIKGGAPSLAFRKRLVEALALDSPLPDGPGAESMDGTIRTKYYTARVKYTVEDTTELPEAVIVVHDSTEAPMNDIDGVKLFVTFDAEEIIGEDGVPLATACPEILSKCWDNGYEHVVWSTCAPGEEEDAEGLWRIREALQCTMWSSAVLMDSRTKDAEHASDDGSPVTSAQPEVALTPTKSKSDYVPPVFPKDIPSGFEEFEKEDALEKVLSNFDSLAGSIREAREFASRTDISDEERRKHAAEVAMNLLAALDDECEESD